MLPGTRRLLARLRQMMAQGTVAGAGGRAVLDEMVHLVASELVAEVCSVYAVLPGDLLELVATEGLLNEAVGRTRLRVGEGIVGTAAATGEVQNVSDAPGHPAFVFRPETGEQPFHSLLAVPVRRSGRTLGVITVQNRVARRYGEDEVEVVETVGMLLAEVLAARGTTDGAEEGIGAALPRRFTATALAPGMVIGPVVVQGTTVAARRVLADDPAHERTRLRDAMGTMRRDLESLIEAGLPDGALDGEDGVASRDVLEATRLVANNGGWLRRINEAVDSGLSAEAAVQRVLGQLRDRMRRIVDPYLRERLADIEDIASRLFQALDGAPDRPPVPPGAILLARRLGPAQLLDWHNRGVAGVVIEEGSPAGHAAILARALAVPALGGARGMLEAVEAGDWAVLDADEGQLILRPDAEVRIAYTRAQEARQLQQARYAEGRDKPAVSRDGTPLQLMLNVGLAMEMQQLDLTGACGIGLFRTEIAMLARGEIADVPDQAALYARVLDAAGNRPVRFRTLDLGGDKLLPDAAPQEEENPAMGWRSLRIGLDRPALLRRQLRAMLLAGGGRPLSVMFPMVATMSEFRAARGLLFTEAARIRPAPSAMKVGAMLEVPALLWQLPALMAEADFVSIGTNDLMQFLFAADRGAPGLAGRYDLLSPPVLDALEAVVAAARPAGRDVSICGEHAARPLEAMVFAAMGITTLSMPAQSLLRIKALLADVDLRDLHAVLAALRRHASGRASLREPLMSWAREHGYPV